MTKKLPSKSQSPLQAKVEALKTLFPEIVSDGKVNLERLREELGEQVADTDERYSFTWHGKRNARSLAHTPSAATLRPCPAESVNWHNSQNLFVEGDNLEVLKLLQKSYHATVTMIYIDPPYNTGKEFVYPDNYQDTLDAYLTYTGQTDQDGRCYGTNSETSGRYHTNWLNMMYPRLKLARNLLRDDGIIFISIDDHELHNLRKLCDEIFGESNFFAHIVWQKKYAATNDAKGFSVLHDHILAYTKSGHFQRNLLPRTEEQNKPYRHDDGDGKGPWRADNLLVKSFSPTGVFPIVNPNTGKQHLPPEGSCWRASRATIEQWLQEGRIYFGKDGRGAPQLKRYLNEVQPGRVPTTWWPFSEVGHNDAANKELKALFGAKAPFDTPKPTTLIQQMLQTATQHDSLILDFFAGSGTTAHAVMAQNAQDGGQRRCISLQLPEPTKDKSDARKAGYHTITHIARERLRRAAEKIRREHPDYQGDLGFKSFRLDSSNLKAWDPDLNDLEASVRTAMNNIKGDRSSEDLLYEILLKEGLDLAPPITETPMAESKTHVIGTANEPNEPVLIACLSDTITLATVEAIVQHLKSHPHSSPSIVFKDTAFPDDTVKANALRILEEHGLRHIITV